MKKKVKEIINKSQNKNICINAAILFQMKLDKLCTTIFIVKSSLFNIIKRAKNRDQYSIIRILKIIFYQKSFGFAKKRYNNADIFYINNNKNLNNLENRVKLLLKQKELI